MPKQGQGYGLNQRNYRVYDEHYALVPKVDVPRSTFHRQWEHKTTGQGGRLIPILVDEVLPGDVHTGQVTIFARLGALLFPLMDNAYIDTQFFFVPCRILWQHWVNFMGQQTNPGDSISFTIPTLTVTGAATAFSAPNNFQMLWDYMGIPIANFAGNNVTFNVLPLRAYNLIFNEWYRDENIDQSAVFTVTDSGDTTADFSVQFRRKRHDYFTSCLPWPLKGGVDVQIPLLGTAPITGLGIVSGQSTNVAASTVWETAGTATTNYAAAFPSTALVVKGVTPNAAVGLTNEPQIFANLAQATGATINALRLAVQTQKLLERDARGGTRYTELLQMHFGVHPQDSRVQRPEYIGGGTTYIQTAAIAQTGATGLTGGSTPLGGLAGSSTASGGHHYTCIGHEHGYIIGIMSLMTRPLYQEGLHRMWTRSTRYDFAWPEFAALGEQAVRNDEIYCQGTAADTQTFGYQERYAEYRFKPSIVSGLFRSKNTGAIDTWHLAQSFSALPTLNSTFLQESAPWGRVLAAGAGTGTTQNIELIADILFDVKTTRPIPAYGIPGGLKGTF